MFSKVLKFFGNLLIYVVIVAITVFGLPRFLSWYLGTPYPMAAITSGSMWPAFKEGDLIFIQAVNQEDLREGDVIVYRNDAANPFAGTFTIHRIVALRERDLITKGDANFSEDPPISYDAVVGRTYRVGNHFVRIPRLGAITVFANKINQ